VFEKSENPGGAKERAKAQQNLAKKIFLPVDDRLMGDLFYYVKPFAGQRN